jgi:hypothetical protein
MHDIAYRTLVYWIDPSPLGLVGNRWAIEHRCSLCRRSVPTDQLLAHAQAHAATATRESPTTTTCPPSKPPGSEPPSPDHSR